MDGGAQYNPRTVEEVFRDLKGRRAGMIKALTTGTALSLSLSQFSFRIFMSHCELCYVCLWWFFFFLFFLADVEEFYQRCDPG
jgi:hypothetical protein